MLTCESSLVDAWMDNFKRKKTKKTMETMLTRGSKQFSKKKEKINVAAWINLIDAWIKPRRRVDQTSLTRGSNLIVAWTKPHRRVDRTSLTRWPNLIDAWIKPA